MAGSINKVILLGRLGADPEVRMSQDNNKIVKFSLATSETWKDKNTNEKKEKTEWHRVVIFSSGLAEVADKFLKKGSLIYLEGQIQTRKYTDQAGIEKYSTEIVMQGYNSNLTMLDSKSDNQSDFSSPSSFKEGDISSPKLENSSNSKKIQDDFDNIDIEDEVPF